MKIAGKLEDKLVKVSRREYIFPAFDYFYETSFFFKIKFMKGQFQILRIEFLLFLGGGDEVGDGAF